MGVKSNKLARQVHYRPTKRKKRNRSARRLAVYRAIQALLLSKGMAVSVRRLQSVPKRKLVRFIRNRFTPSEVSRYLPVQLIFNSQKDASNTANSEERNESATNQSQQTQSSDNNSSNQAQETQSSTDNASNQKGQAGPKHLILVANMGSLRHSSMAAPHVEAAQPSISAGDFDFSESGMSGTDQTNPDSDFDSSLDPLFSTPDNQSPVTDINTPIKPTIEIPSPINFQSKNAYNTVESTDPLDSELWLSLQQSPDNQSTSNESFISNLENINAINTDSQSIQHDISNDSFNLEDIDQDILNDNRTQKSIEIPSPDNFDSNNSYKTDEDPDPLDSELWLSLQQSQENHSTSSEESNSDLEDMNSDETTDEEK